MATAVIFGINGQDGKLLSELLIDAGIKVVGISRADFPAHQSIADFACVEALIKSHLPQYIFHLAANSTTRHSALFDNHEAISTATINILESVRLHCPECRIFLSGSAMQFKNDGMPINEHTEFDASSAYSVARIHSVYAGRYYRSAFGLQVYIGYFFNHDSPLRSEQHVNQKIAQAVKRIAAGSTEKLVLGNVDVKKEFNYAGDVVEAIWTLVNQDIVLEAVIGSGQAHSIKEWAQYCFNKVGLDYDQHVVLRSDFVPEYQVLVSDPVLMRSLGWAPKTSFHALADMMMETA